MADLEAELARFETELARFEQPEPHGYRPQISGGNGSIHETKARLPPPRLPPPAQGGPAMVRMSGVPPPQIMPPPPSLRPPLMQQGQPPPPPRPGPPPPHLLAPAPRILQAPMPNQPPVILGPAPPQHAQEVSQGPSGNSYQYGGDFFGYQQDPNAGYSASLSYIAPQTTSGGAQQVEDGGNTTKKSKDSESKKRKPVARQAAGEKWFDPTLAEWDESDFRIFVGDLGNEVNEDILSKAFAKYPTFQKAKVIRDKRTNKTKGYGFVSFVDGNDFAKAIKEMQGKYIGNRPCKLRKSTWKERSDPDPKRKYKEKPQKGNAYKRQRGVLHK